MLQDFDNLQFRIGTVYRQNLDHLALVVPEILTFEKRHGRPGRVGPAHEPSRLLCL